jgi:hypothetical protein
VSFSYKLADMRLGLAGTGKALRPFSYAPSHYLCAEIKKFKAWYGRSFLGQTIALNSLKIEPKP